MQARFGDDVHAAAQKFLSIQQLPTECQSTGAGRKRHQQIDIAVLSFSTANHRAEHAHARYAAAAGKRQKLFAVGFDQRVHAFSVAASAVAPKGQGAGDSRRRLSTIASFTATPVQRPDDVAPSSPEVVLQDCYEPRCNPHQC